MDPIKLVKQIAFAGVITLIVMGGAGFYLGYSAGRGDLSEVRSYLAAMNLPTPGDAGARPPVTAALDMSAKTDLSPVLAEIRAVGGQLKKLERWTESNSDFPDVAPLVGEVKAISAQLKRLETTGDTKLAAPDLSPVLAELRTATAQIKKLEASVEAKPATPDLSPLLAEIKAISAQMKKPERPSGAPDNTSSTPVMAELKVFGEQLRKLEKWTDANNDFPDVIPLVNEVKAVSAQLKRFETGTDAKPVAPDLSPILAEIKAATAQIKKLEALAEIRPAAPDFSPMLAEIKAVGAQMKKLERPAGATDTPSAPVVAELKAFGDQLRKLEKVALQTAETPRDDPKLREEVGRLRQLAVSAGEQLNTCQVKLASLDARPQQTTIAPRQQPAAEETQVAARTPQTAATGGIVVLYDSFYLKKDQNKTFDDLDLKVSLQGVASRSARVDVNNQSVSIAFGERKEIVYNNMTCELNLTETDLSASQARFNIACKK